MDDNGFIVVGRNGVEFTQASADPHIHRYDRFIRKGIADAAVLIPLIIIGVDHNIIVRLVAAALTGRQCGDGQKISVIFQIGSMDRRIFPGLAVPFLGIEDHIIRIKRQLAQIALFRGTFLFIPFIICARGKEPENQFSLGNLFLFHGSGPHNGLDFLGGSLRWLLGGSFRFLRGSLGFFLRSLCRLLGRHGCLLFRRCLRSFPGRSLGGLFRDRLLRDGPGQLVSQDGHRQVRQQHCQNQQKSQKSSCCFHEKSLLS